MPFRSRIRGSKLPAGIPAKTNLFGREPRERPRWAKWRPFENYLSGTRCKIWRFSSNPVVSCARHQCRSARSHASRDLDEDETNGIGCYDDSLVRHCPTGHGIGKSWIQCRSVVPCSPSSREDERCATNTYLPRPDAVDVPYRCDRSVKA